MKSILYSFIILILLSGCASFSDRIVKDHKQELIQNDLKKLEGHYDLFPDSSYDRKGKLQTIEPEDSKSGHNLNYFVKSPEAKYSYDKGYTIEIKVVGPDRLKFITKKENVAIDSVELSGKLKNGLFYLDNTYLKRNGIPYIAGGYTNYKTRIGLTKDNGLLVNYAYDNSGALLFLFWAGSDYNLAYHYRRFETIHQ
ncbi:hypothetical protein [Flavobacterium reichenbachii]|uniref:Lipoprotein n=1 Tax=Flavobacterium reichenbachii TaxID=362418 RepID=A0A085ZRX8_9FLAO|nr:hypothetical protein [Flavobacterium reichenbachii]KFF07192.1 hypothetical protein IW19_17515 [Flavobacterium reichenbachii]OXB13315.1 hypothetical protein B0A68_16290 [Flavobacterium reichenbachii]